VRFAALLLAAGRSDRMRSHKALLDWEGRPLLRYQLDQIAMVPGIAQIVVVTGFEPDPLRGIIGASPLALEAHNAAYSEGKAGSVRAGMQALAPGVDAVILIAVDQPRAAPLLRAVAEAHAAGGRAITVPAFGGRRGHPIIFAASLFDELRSVDDASTGVRAVVRRHAKSVHEVTVADAAVLLDLNTPDDVARAREQRRGTRA